MEYFNDIMVSNLDNISKYDFILDLLKYNDTRNMLIRIDIKNIKILLSTIIDIDYKSIVNIIYDIIEMKLENTFILDLL